MMDSGTHRRRAAARHVEDDHRRAPSILESLVNYLSDRLARSAMRRVTRGAHEVVRWTILRLILGWVGAAILTGGIFLLLGAGVKGLEALKSPLWLAYLLTGVFALLLALVALKGILWPKEDEEGD